MPTESAELDALRQELARLAARVAALEAANGAAPAAPAPAPPPAPTPEPISEETLLVISAVVAAFLGVKARVRQVRLIRRDAWVQQGRVTIQASHQLQ